MVMPIKWLLPFLWLAGCGRAALLPQAAPATEKTTPAVPNEEQHTATMRPPDAGEPPVDPLAELAQLGHSLVSDGPEGGGSIRGKRRTAMPRSEPCELRGKVERVVRGRFPLVAIRLKVLEPARAGPGAAMRNNDTLVILPHVMMSTSLPVMSDPATVVNAGAYYMRPGDRITACINGRSGRAWNARSIRRQ
jgi:hypothetical protein